MDSILNLTNVLGKDNLILVVVKLINLLNGLMDQFIKGLLLISKNQDMENIIFHPIQHNRNNNNKNSNNIQLVHQNNLMQKPIHLIKTQTKIQIIIHTIITKQTTYNHLKTALPIKPTKKATFI